MQLYNLPIMFIGIIRGYASQKKHTTLVIHKDLESQFTHSCCYADDS